MLNCADIPVVILAGGLGTRLREETEFRPKPMVPIGGRPILWHIMKLYSHYGFKHFIICLGYRGEMIRDFFFSYHYDEVDCTVDTLSGSIVQHSFQKEHWKVTLVYTGATTMTGGRIARIKDYVTTDRFCVTYGDGVADVDLHKLLAFHERENTLGTVTAVNLPSRFGNLDLCATKVRSFHEKKVVTDEWINGGFFVFKREFFDYLSDDSQLVLEQEPLIKLAYDGQLSAYKHSGFWQCMDTIREHQLLESLWKTGNPPWALWQQNPRQDFSEKQKVYHAAL